jgi:integrase
MGMRIVGRLKAKQVINAKPPKGKDAALIPDGGNLFLQLTKNKDGGVRRSWTFKYQLDHKRHELGLGPLFSVSLSGARDKARSLRQQLLDGVDPLAAKRSAKQARISANAKAITFKEVAEMYLRSHGDGWKSGKHADQWRSTLEQYVFPRIGSMSVADIDTDDVVRVLDPIWKSIPETASRIRGRIESILGFAHVRKFRTSSANPARWRDHLEEVFPAKGKLRPVKPHVAMHYTDVPALMAELRSRRGLSARGLEFLILTGSRAGAVRYATFDEIDFKARLWTVPVEPGRKITKPHKVPLSNRAIEILKSLKGRSGRIFPLSKNAMNALLARIYPGTDVTVHGFRSAFTDWADERTLFPKFVVDMAKAHVIKDGTERAYRRSELLEKRRRLLAMWADYCSRPPVKTSGKVVQLHEAVGSG